MSEKLQPVAVEDLLPVIALTGIDIAKHLQSIGDEAGSYAVLLFCQTIENIPLAPVDTTKVQALVKVMERIAGSSTGEPGCFYTNRANITEARQALFEFRLPT